jgi:prolyl-tRNA editing enzyme YbaK/EbsC (Cys-tRNA(Pro) deacylase)
MTEKLSSSAQRVQTFLKEKGFEFRVKELPASTRTAKDAANAVGCRVRHIAKSLVFKGKETGSPIMVIASGINRVDEKKLAALAGEPVGKADADYVRENTGFAIGGVPPVGHIKPLKTFVDEDLLQYDAIWAAAGTPHAVFELKSRDLMKMIGGEAVDIK